MVPSPSADGVAAPPAAQWVVFACGPQWYGLPLDHSREILPLRPITRLPGCEASVCGLMAIRGRVHTVFDFGMLLRGQSSLHAPNPRLVVLIINGRRVAAVVDEVIAVSRDALDVGPAGAPPEQMDAGDLLGQVVLDGRTFLALDPDRILGRLLT